MFKIPSKKAQYEVQQEEKKKAWRDKHRGYNHMEHIDKLKISLQDSNFEINENSSIRLAQKDGHRRFYIKNGETCIKENGKFIRLMDLYPNNRATP